MQQLSTLLIQIVVILITARVVGLLFRRIHQPQVIGEMVAGILLGPSLLGWLAPGVSTWLFPPASLSSLNAIGQIGMVLFMFLVGLEFNPLNIASKKRAALVISHTSIIAPFLLGSLLSLYLYPRLSDDSVNFTTFALFVGTAMSITAFPVLARILAEHNLTQTSLGTLAISCAAIDDVSAWSILAGVVLLARRDSTFLSLLLAFAALAVFILVMLFAAPRLLHKLELTYRKHGKISQPVLSIVFLTMMLSAWITEQLGVHALFGAFLAGIVMPKAHDFTNALTEKLKGVAVVLLLPLFFAFSGLRTSVGLLRGSEMWLYWTLIFIAAIAGKFGGATLAARATGIQWREAAAVGVLMNTRGLIELVVLNIGLDIHVLSPALFTVMVLMALVTTLMTSPLLHWLWRPQDEARY
jgi:Kef-type K+ transport system membrane component KefB